MPKRTYHRSSSPVFVCIRASTHIRRLKQNERLSLRPRWAGRLATDRRWMDVKLVEHSEHSGGVMDLGQVCDS